VAEALAERCRAGVGVNVLLDGFGTLNMPADYVALMKNSGCHVVYFRPLGSPAFRKYTNRNHRQIRSWTVASDSPRAADPGSALACD
jgi:cardiolipin synthase A/B